MAARGAQPGNRNATKNKEWFDALRKQCVQRKTLDKVAAIVCEKAEAGEPWAVQEIANRFDGKPAQALEHSGSVGILTHEEFLASVD
jgi:hypothetical protein